MKETIPKINKTKNWFFEKINRIDKRLASSSRKKGRRLKSTESEMKKEKLQQTPQKYKASKETTSNCMPIKWTTWKKWTDS